MVSDDTHRQMNMEDENQLLNTRDSKGSGSYSCLRFTVVVLTLALIVATSAIVGTYDVSVCELCIQWNSSTSTPLK